MKEFRTGDVSRNTGDLFEAAAAAPVAITRHRKPRFVIMTKEPYERLTLRQVAQVALESPTCRRNWARCSTGASRIISAAVEFPAAGQVIDYRYLWKREAERGETEGRKGGRRGRAASSCWSQTPPAGI